MRTKRFRKKTCPACSRRFKLPRKGHPGGRYVKYCTRCGPVLDRAASAGDRVRALRNLIYYHRWNAKGDVE